MAEERILKCDACGKELCRYNPGQDIPNHGGFRMARLELKAMFEPSRRYSKENSMIIYAADEKHMVDVCDLECLRNFIAKKFIDQGFAPPHPVNTTA